MNTFYAQMVGLAAGTVVGWISIILLAQILIGAIVAMFAGPIIAICIYKVISERLMDKK